MSKIKIVIVLAILVLALFVAHNTKYQQIVNEGTEIANEQCTIVSPLIAERKDLHSESVVILTTTENVEAYTEKMNEYVEVSEEYIQAQDDWLIKQKAFIDRWDFKFFTPAYIKDIADLQYRAREADIRVQEGVVKLLHADDNDSSELSIISIDITIERNKIYEKLDKAWEESDGNFDIRNFFITFPDECPSNDSDPPDVQDTVLFSPSQCTSTNQCPKGTACIALEDSFTSGTCTTEPVFGCNTELKEDSTETKCTDPWPEEYYQ